MLELEPESAPMRTGGRELIGLSWPMAIENLLNMSLLWVDSIIINRKLGTGPFASVQVSSQIFNMLIIIVAVVATGAAIVISHQIGAQQREEAGRTAAQSIGLGVLVSLVVGAGIYAACPTLLGWLGARGDVLTGAVQFSRILAVSLPANALMMLLGSIIRAVGDTRGPMIVTMLVNVLNAVLNFFLVWGLPGLGGGLGLVGSATGTSVARVIGVLLLAWMLMGRSDLPVRLRRLFHFDRETVGRIARMGVPGAMEWMAWQSAQFVLSVIIAPLGTVVIAARGLAAQAENFTFVPVQSIGNAASILVGQLTGAGHQKDAVRTGRISLVYGVASSLALGLLLILFPRQIAGIFTRDQALIAATVTALRIEGAYKAGQAINIVAGSIFRGAGNPGWPTGLTSVGTWSISVTLSFVLVRMGLGLPGILWATLADEYIRGSINLWYFTTSRWRNRHV